MRHRLASAALSLALCTLSLSASAQTVTSVMPSPLPTAGATITINGTGFGPTPGAVTVGASACTVSSWADTRITCAAPPGSGSGANLVVRVGASASPAFPLAYAPPTVMTVLPLDGPTVGGASIVISGANFFTTGTLSWAGASATTSSWTHSEIRLTTPPGQGSATPITIVVGGQVVNTTYRYGQPRITSIAPTSGPLGGGNTLTIMGDNFGTSPLVTIGSSTCTVLSNSHTMIQCRVPAGAGLQPVVVLAADQRSPSTTNYQYGTPEDASTDAADASADVASDVLSDVTSSDALSDVAPSDVISDSPSESSVDAASPIDAANESGPDSAAPVDASTADSASDASTADASRPPTATGGCACAVTVTNNTHTQSRLAWLAAIAAAVALVRRSRRRA
ncbi:MAG: IPT/TIG domain-containing protein [Myxococcales bacterium]|nr:IPT/TIG domain-containing protein [Myxococcales bacterium]